MKHINVKRLSACLLVCVLMIAAALCVHAQDGRTLTGTVVMNGRTDEAVTVVLAAAATGEEVGRTTLDYPAADFTFTGVPAGDYELLASAPGFRPVRQAVTVADTDADVTLTLCLFGDANGDGKLSTVDAAKVNAFVQGLTTLTAYQAACVDVLGTDGKVTNVDTACINSIVRGVFDPTPDECIHSYTILLPAVEPTCTTPGFTAGEKCRLCGLALVAQEVIPATGHTVTTLPGIPATCTIFGMSDGKWCETCGTLILPQYVVPATGHTVVTVPSKAASCTETGLTEGSKCSGCGLVFTEQEVIPALGHEYADRVCTRCGGLKASEGLAFTSNGGGTCLVSGIGECTDTEIVIPSVSPDGDTVTGIRYQAFSGNTDLTSVTIPEGVTSIGSSAFSGCTSLARVTIPEGVTTLDVHAFSGCTSLTSITIPESVTTIGTWAFANCSGLTSVTIPGGVKSINGWAFANCTGLTGIIIPEGVTSVGDYAFSGCTNLTINCEAAEKPAGWSSDWNPSGCPVVWGYRPASQGLAFTSNSNGTCYVSGIGTCTDTEIVIPGVSPDGDTVTGIGNSAFYGCSAIRSITIPDSVTSIDGAAFECCTSLADIRLPQGLARIETETFWGCESLTDFVIPDSVTFIGTGAFGECYGLTSIRIPISVTNMEESVFAFCGGLTVRCAAASKPSGWYNSWSETYCEDGATLQVTWNSVS